MNTRRILTAGALVATGALVLAGCSTGDDTAASGGDKEFAGETIVVTSFGGDWEKAFIEAVVDPFEEETGAKVELITLYRADALAQVMIPEALDYP